MQIKARKEGMLPGRREGASRGVIIHNTTRLASAMALLVFLLCAAVSVACCYPGGFQDLDYGSTNRTSIRFLAVGDWGGLPKPPYITDVQTATADEMSRVAEQMGADFILALGDNFYFSGVRSVYSPRFKDTFESVYTSKFLQVPWYVIAGNHDHEGSVKAQIEYSHKSDRWRFPANYYELNFRIPNTGKILTIIMLDTFLLCGHSLNYMDKHPRRPLRPVGANRQLTWLQGRLALSKADFLLVAGHYPVWSVSRHGPTKCLLQKLHPLLNKYNATAYFCGHDHNLQYIEESGVGYVVSGAGNFLDTDVHHWDYVPNGTVKFFSDQESYLGGFVHAEVSKSQMTVTFFQAKGTSLYRTVLSQREFK